MPSWQGTVQAMLAGRLAPPHPHPHPHPVNCAGDAGWKVLGGGVGGGHVGEDGAEGFLIGIKTK